MCSLYTLSENNKLFKKFNLKNDLFLNINKEDHFTYKIGNFYEFEKLLNSLSLRRFAFRLIKPVLSKTYFSFSSLKEKETIKKKLYKKETILLKKYLQKFKYNYYHYFYYQKGNFENFPKEKEMNLAAIKLLFLIVGI